MPPESLAPRIATMGFRHHMHRFGGPVRVSCLRYGGSAQRTLVRQEDQMSALSAPSSTQWDNSAQVRVLGRAARRRLSR